MNGITDTSDGATQARWTFNRAGGLAGLIAAALMVLSEVLAGTKPNEPDSSDQELIAFYSDRGEQLTLYLSALIAVVASLFFLWFLVALRDRLLKVDRSGLTSFFFAAGLVFVAITVVGTVIGSAVPASLLYDDRIELAEDDTLRVLLVLGNHWMPATIASVAAVVVFGASFLARRHHLYRRWLAWVGMVAAVLMLLAMPAFAGFMLVILIIWTSATGVWVAWSGAIADSPVLPKAGR